MAIALAFDILVDKQTLNTCLFYFFAFCNGECLAGMTELMLKRQKSATRNAAGYQQYCRRKYSCCFCQNNKNQEIVQLLIH